MPWDQIIAGAVVAILWVGGWRYGSRPEQPPRPPRRPRVPIAR
jgi:hypothetical protein